MPPTRASSHAGPSRLPYNGSSWNITVDDEGHLQTPNLSSRRHSSRVRSVSFQPPDLTSIPNNSRSSRHRRKTSNESHYSIRLTPPPTRAANSKAVIRKSLTGENVFGMNINDRAHTLAEVAGDCLVTIVRDALRADDGKRRRSSVNDEVKKAWDGLYGIRQSYIFPPHSPPFPSFTDTLGSLHYQIRATLNAQTLSRAIILSNLATFVWTISRPDEAGQAFAVLDPDLEDEESESRRRSTRNKGKTQNDDPDDIELLKRVKRRNILLLIAWKKFWLVVVPLEKRTSEMALRLWLDFATQIALLYQRPFAEDPNLYHPSFPIPTGSLLAELFSPSAVGRFGQWTLSEDFDSRDFGEEKIEVEERWSILAKRRTEELSDTDQAELQRKYPYDKFKTEIIAYVQHEVLTSPINALLTPVRRRLLTGATYSPHTSRLGFDDEESSEAEADMTVSASWSGDSDIQEESEEESNVGEAELSEGEEPIDMDILALAAAEFEAEEGGSEEHEDQQQLPLVNGFVEYQNEESDEDIPIRVKHATFAQESVKDEDFEEDLDDEGEWIVKNAVTPKKLGMKPNNHILGARTRQEPRFDWTRRQDDAVQVEWESQSYDGILPHPDHQMNETDSTDEEQDEGEEEERENDASEENNLEDPAEPPIQQEFTSESSPLAAGIVEVNPRSSPPPLRAAKSSIAPLPLTNPSYPYIIQPSASSSANKPIIPVDEELSEEEEIPEGFDDDAELIPSESQLDPVGQANIAPQTVNNVVDDQADEFEDLLPRESQFEPHRPTTTFNHRDSDLIVDDSDAELNDLNSDNGDQDEIAPPTSQGQYISSRPRKSQEAHSFIIPDKQEDAQDRQLFFPASPLISVQPSLSREVSVKVEPVQDMLGLHGFVSALNGFDFRRQRGSTVPPVRDEDDPFLHDEDGSPLEPDELCLLPIEARSSTQDLNSTMASQLSKSKLHGKSTGSQSGYVYCRLTGKRKWTKEEELLLYRTVQKIPLEEEYPLRTVWDLYGEFGKFGNQLKWYNTQHMKDKLRTTVKRRQNEGRKVEGRVRAWAKRGTREREEYEAEMEEYKRFRDEEEAAELEEQEDEDRGDDGGEGDIEMEGEGQRPPMENGTLPEGDNHDEEIVDVDHGNSEEPQSNLNGTNEGFQDGVTGMTDDDDFPDPVSFLDESANEPNDRESIHQDGDFPEAEDLDLNQVSEDHAQANGDDDFAEHAPSPPTSAQLSQSRAARYAARSRKRASSDIHPHEHKSSDDADEEEGRGKKRSRGKPPQPTTKVPFQKSRTTKIPTSVREMPTQEATKTKPPTHANNAVFISQIPVSPPRRRTKQPRVERSRTDPSHTLQRAARKTASNDTAVPQPKATTVNDIGQRARKSVAPPSTVAHTSKTAGRPDTDEIPQSSRKTANMVINQLQRQEKEDDFEDEHNDESGGSDENNEDAIQNPEIDGQNQDEEDDLDDANEMNHNDDNDFPDAEEIQQIQDSNEDVPPNPYDDLDAGITAESENRKEERERAEQALEARRKRIEMEVKKGKSQKGITRSRLRL